MEFNNTPAKDGGAAPVYIRATDNVVCLDGTFCGYHFAQYGFLLRMIGRWKFHWQTSVVVASIYFLSFF
jgi:hypothetical protein